VEQFCCDRAHRNVLNKTDLLILVPDECQIQDLRSHTICTINAATAQKFRNRGPCTVEQLWAKITEFGIVEVDLMKLDLHYLPWASGTAERIMLRSQLSIAKYTP